MAPKRRSLRERDQSAIAAPIEVLAGQTAIDLPGAPENEQAQPPPGAQTAPAGSEAPTGAPGPQRAPGGAGEGARRLGIYFHPDDFTNAKAAYLAAWQAGGNADTFAGWIAAVLLHHAKLSPAQRADAALPPRGDGGGSTRSFALPRAVHDAVHAAVIADQGVGRWVSTSTWAGVALHAEVTAAQQHSGVPLLVPPIRLPCRLER